MPSLNPAMNASALCDRARRLAQRGEFTEADRLLRWAISLDPQCFEAYHWLEYVLEARENFNEAVAVHEWGKWLQVASEIFKRVD